MKDNLMKHINEQNAWHELTPGGMIYGSGNSEHFNTGEWRVAIPTFIEDKCKQCLLCTPVCPDSSIPVVDGKRGEFDYLHKTACENLISAFRGQIFTVGQAQKWINMTYLILLI